VPAVPAARPASQPGRHFARPASQGRLPARGRLAGKTGLAAGA
jgi:hypothetical protein